MSPFDHFWVAPAVINKNLLKPKTKPPFHPKLVQIRDRRGGIKDKFEIVIQSKLVVAIKTYDRLSAITIRKMIY